LELKPKIPERNVLKKYFLNSISIYIYVKESAPPICRNGLDMENYVSISIGRNPSEGAPISTISTYKNILENKNSVTFFSG